MVMVVMGEWTRKSNMKYVVADQRQYTVKIMTLIEAFQFVTSQMKSC